MTSIPHAENPATTRDITVQETSHHEGEVSGAQGETAGKPKEGARGETKSTGEVSPSEQRKDAAGESVKHTDEATGKAKDAAKSAASEVGSGLESAKESTKETLAKTRESARETASSAGEKTEAAKEETWAVLRDVAARATELSEAAKRGTGETSEEMKGAAQKIYDDLYKAMQVLSFTTKKAEEVEKVAGEEKESASAVGGNQQEEARGVVGAATHVQEAAHTTQQLAQSAIKRMAAAVVATGDFVTDAVSDTVSSLGESTKEMVTQAHEATQKTQNMFQARPEMEAEKTEAGAGTKEAASMLQRTAGSETGAKEPKGSEVQRESQAAAHRAVGSGA